jgi:predicted porin
MKLPVSLNVVLAAAGLSWLAQPVLAQPAPGASPPPPGPDQPAATLEIYGTVAPYTVVGRTTGASAAGTMGSSLTPVASGINAPARVAIDPSTSNIGFRGGVDLIPGLAIVWQVENTLPVDGAAAAVGFASRNTELGITGKFGTLFVGNWDTPYKWNSNQIVNPIRIGFLADYNGILHGPGFGVNPVTTQPGRAGALSDAAFYRRVGNSIQYWTPTMSGLSARLSYGANEGRAARSGATPPINPSIFSANVMYDTGPIRVRYAYELHKDYFGLSAGTPSAANPGFGATAFSNTNKKSLDQGHEVIAQYTHAAPGHDTRIVGIFEFLSYSNDDHTPPPMMGAVPSKEYSRSAFYGLIEQAFGKHRLWATFGLALDGSCKLVNGDTCTTKGLGANEVALGYIYRFSRSTDFFAAAFRLTNSKSGQYTIANLQGTAAPGADAEVFGIGIVHQFSHKFGGPVKATAPPAQPSLPDVKPAPPADATPPPPGDATPPANPPAPTPPNP